MSLAMITPRNSFPNTEVAVCQIRKTLAACRGTAAVKQATEYRGLSNAVAECGLSSLPCGYQRQIGNDPEVPVEGVQKGS